MIAATKRPLEQRYGVPHALTPAVWNPVLDSLLAHRSVRRYLPTALPEGTLEVLIAAAQSAATSSNLQSWSVIAVHDPERRQRFAEIAGGQAHIVQAPLFLVWVADLSRAKRQAEREGQVLEALDYLEPLLFSSIDAALAAQNAVVALESLGLSSVYIGALRNDIAAVSEELNLPANSFPVFGLCVGYADPSYDGGVKPRLGQDVVLHIDQYSTAGEDEAVRVYSERLQAYYTSQQLQPVTWPDLLRQRLQSVVTLGGRVKLAGLLRARGFSLD
ncbi:MAG: NADPH-dependent oxidoreductase [Pseudomonas sp.]|uniref:NADPH-dependent oxidoreductase n=1 Tax=Pseudomonas sp. TaxID=306 RepID=UPI0030F3689B